MRVARRALDGVRLLAERGDDEGDEEIRVALRKPPINGIRKARKRARLGSQPGPRTRLFLRLVVRLYKLRF